MASAAGFGGGQRPSIRCITTCTFLHGPGAVDVLVPAWSTRCLTRPAPRSVDLSLSRSLAALQEEDGSFVPCPALAAALGLRNPGILVGAAAGGDTAGGRLAGALLVLKTARKYRRDLEEPLEQICGGAFAYCCRCLGMSKAKVRSLLDAVEEPSADLRLLPGEAVSILRANFGHCVLWSQCELWVRLLPRATQRALQQWGGLLCPRNFLVSLATASSNPHDLCETYLAYRQGGKLFVGTLAGDTDRPSGVHDALRQGRHLEAALVSFGWLEEDRVLTELTLPCGVRAYYAAAPDALEDEADTAVAPLEPGDEAAYAAAGYELQEEEEAAAALGQPRVRVWRASGRAAAESSRYAEVKKAARLASGRKGEHQRAKYWAQAALAGCGSVWVATTDGSDSETVTAVRRFGLDELMGNPAALWADLQERLGRILSSTCDSEGRWTVKLTKSGCNRPAVQVQPGWSGHEDLHETSQASRTEQVLVDSATAAERCLGSWEMQAGHRWCSWKPEGVVVDGNPGDAMQFRVGAYDYRAVFGPSPGEGFQENLATGRRRQLRFNFAGS